MWQPFDSRFRNILDKIGLDQQIVTEELQFALIGDLKTTMQGAAVKRREEMMEALSNVQTIQAEQTRRRYCPLHNNNRTYTLSWQGFEVETNTLLLS